MAGGAAGELRVYVLGAFRVVHDGKPLVGGRLDGRSIEDRLFKLVAISAHAKRSQAQLAMELRRGVTLSESRVDSVVKSLRKDLKAQTNSGEWIGSRTREIELGPGPDRRVTIDAALFADAHSEAFAVRTVEGYEQALALYTGDLLHDDNEAHIPGLEDRRQHLRRLFLDLIDALDALYKAQGYPPRAIAQYRALLPRLRATDQLPPANRRAQDLLAHLDRIVEEHGGMATHSTGPIASASEARTDPLIFPSLSPVIDYAPPAPDATCLISPGEVEQLRDLLQPGGGGKRLVTLTGPPLAGKTQLALNVAKLLAPSYPDRMVFVNLAKEPKEGDVLAAITRRLGISAQLGALAEWLDSRKMLLLLDNCEHLRDKCASLALNVWDKKREVKILATSRGPLGLGDREYEYSVAGLRYLTSSANVTAAQLLDTPAGSYFVQVRGRYVPNYRPTDEEARIIARICEYFEGSPGLISMVAAKRTDQSAQWILDQVRSNNLYIVSTGTPENDHQRSAEATIKWSYDLLEDEQQWLLRVLTVMRGGFSDTLVVRACCRPGWTAEIVRGHLAILRQNSLVLVDGPHDNASHEQDPPRLRLHQTVRDSMARLLSSEEHAAFMSQLLAWAAELGAEAAPYLEGVRDLRKWMRILNRDYAALRTALEWGIDNADTDEDRARARQLGAALGFFWVVRHDHLDGEHWLKRLRETLAKDTLEYAKILYASAFLFVWSDLDKSLEWLEYAERTARMLGDLDLLGKIFSLRAYSLIEQGELDRAEKLLVDAGDEAGRTNDPLLLAATAMVRGYAAQLNQPLPHAQVLLQEAIGHAQRGNVVVIACYSRMRLAEIFIVQRQYDKADEQLKRLLDDARDIDHVYAEAVGHYLHARLLLECGNFEQAETAIALGALAAQKSGDKIAVALVTWVRGESYRVAGSFEEAFDSLCDGLMVARDTHEFRILSLFFPCIGRVVRQQGRTEQALPWAYAGLVYHRRLQDRLGQAIDLEELAALRATLAADYAPAARWLGAAARERKAIHAAQQEDDATAGMIVRGVAAMLGEERHQRVLAAGSGDSLAAAADSAMAWCEATGVDLGPVRDYLALLRR